MKSKLFLLLATTCFLFFGAQTLHIQYLHVRSAIANVNDDLFINSDKVLFTESGKIIWTDPAYQKDKASPDDYYFSELSAKFPRKFVYTSYIYDPKDGRYLVTDHVPQIKWEIIKGQTKKILGYDCEMAKTIFRGSHITAYFARALPYSAGPFKFYGLPGVILDIREDNSSFNIWKAVKVEQNSKVSVNWQPDLSATKKMDIEDFTKLHDAVLMKKTSQINVPDSQSKSIGVRNILIEKQYEWE